MVWFLNYGGDPILDQTKTIPQFWLPNILPPRGLADLISAYQIILTDLAGTTVTLTRSRQIKEKHPLLMNENPLAPKAKIRVNLLQSATPVAGPLIAAARNLWGSVAAKWLLYDVVRQQNEFNHLAAAQWQFLDERISAQDYDLVVLTRQVTELNAALRQTQKRVRELEKQLSQQETES